MPSFEEKWVTVTARILKLTQSGDIEWHVARACQSFAADLQDQVSCVFHTDYKMKRLRLYERIVKLRPVAASIASLFGSVEPSERLTKETRVFLEFTDEKGLGVWTVPHTDVLCDLLNAVRYRASGAAEFLEEMLGEESTEATGRANNRRDNTFCS